MKHDSSFNRPTEPARLVVDQKRVELEHIIQDVGTPGIEDFLLSDFEDLLESKHLKLWVEKDGGLYDAVNRGYRRATGDILAYLNWDEQYLPGALKTLKRLWIVNHRLSDSGRLVATSHERPPRVRKNESQTHRRRHHR